MTSIIKNIAKIVITKSLTLSIFALKSRHAVYHKKYRRLAGYC